jgi:FtsX-like permease family protein
VAIFSAVYAMLYRPLPLSGAGRLVVPVSTNAARGFDRASVPFADYADWRNERDIFDHVSLYRSVGLDLAEGSPERVNMSYAVTRRTLELGVRLALGATPRSLVRLVLGRAGRLTATGMVLGMAGAIVLGRLMRGLLFGVGPADPLALVACAVPARRASHTEPLTALRSE